MVLQAIPNVLNGFSGCSSQMDCANKYINDNSATQYAMNKSLHSGGGRSRKTSKRRGLRRFMRYKKNKRGGDDAVPSADVPAAAAPDAPAQDYYSCETPDPNFTTVVQFDSYGPDVSPLNSNNSSLDTNTTSIAGRNNALNDCYATGTCPEAACTAAQSGGRRFSTRIRKSTTKSKKSRKAIKSKKKEHKKKK